MNECWLPVTAVEMRQRGWDEVDFIYITGDAYVDHPSFGPAIISRVLEKNGYRIGMIPQPDWKDETSIQVFGRPRLGVLISGGNMDSMVNHYTVSRKHRSTDAYSPGGEMGKRPDYAVVVYGNLVRKVYKDIPVIIGGIEASLRRLGHYDYWSDKVKHSVLVDSQADLISYGMGEHSIVEIADALASGLKVNELTYIRGTVYKTKHPEIYGQEFITLPEYDQIVSEKKAYAESFLTQYNNTDPFTAKVLVEKYHDHLYVVQNPPALPLTTEEMDEVYSLPYTREPHPMYEAMGGIPAMQEIRFSLISNRGCFGSCSFCALTFQQGRIVQVRSHESLVQEATELTKHKEFKGYIHDVGGPTANFRHPACEKQLSKGACSHRQCLFPTPCKNMNADHSDYIALLRKLRAVPGVKKVFIRSGIRFDYLLADKSDAFLRELCKYHVSGQLKVAPEHVSDAVLQKMGKPEHSVFQQFCRKYNKVNEQMGLKQYMVPYLMSSHPGTTMKEAVKLAEYVRDLGYMPEQVQDFYPTPSTLSTCMYYTGQDPRTMEPVYVPKNPHEKAMQRALIQYRDPKNRTLIEEALRIAGRTDLIGYGRECLIRPAKDDHEREGFGGRKTPSTGRNTGVSGTKSSGDNEPKKRKLTTGERSGNGTSGSRSVNVSARDIAPRKKKTIRNVHKKK